MPEGYRQTELDGVFEKLVTRANGDPKTNEDLWAALVAMHHDSRERDGYIASLVNKHLTEDVNMSQEEFAVFMGKRDAMLDSIHDELDDVRAVVHSVQCVNPKEMEKFRKEHKEFHNEHLQQDHRRTDEDGEDYTERRGRYTKEQIVTAVILLMATVGLNAGLTYIIVHALESAFK